MHAHRRGTHGRFPLLLERRDDAVRKRVFMRLDGGLQRVQLRPLLVTRQLHERHGVATLTVEALLGHAVEEREELVELLVRDRIELVRVAPRTAHGQAHERVDVASTRSMTYSTWYSAAIAPPSKLTM